MRTEYLSKAGIFQMPDAIYRLLVWLLAGTLSSIALAGADTNSNKQRMLVEDFNTPKRHTLSSDKHYGAFADDKSLGKCYIFSLSILPAGEINND